MATANDVDRAARDPERVDQNPLKQGAILRTALFNAPFLLLFFGIQQSLPAIFQALLVGLVLFIVPGLSWTDRRGHDGFVVIFRMVVWSLLASLACWLVLLPLPGPTSRLGFLFALALVTNVGLVLGHKKGWYDPAPFRAPTFRLVGLAASVMFVQSYLGAVHFIPALEDQDMETQGTSYGLIHELSPTFVTDRGTRFFFAHPLLLHFWIGAGALVSDDLDRLRHYHEGSLSVAETSNAPLDATTWRKLLDRAKVDYELFERDPVLLPTRAPNLFLGVFVLFPLGFLVYRLGGSRWVAAGACVLYSTLPEVYVRSAYGGYMGMTNFVTLSGAYFYLEAAGLLPNRDGVLTAPQAPRRAFGAGLLSAWANQKAALIPAAAGLHAGLRLLADGGAKDLIRRARANSALITAILIGVGFVLGWMTFAAYGLLEAPRDFILDHVKNHIVRRLKMSDVKLIEQPTQGWYYLSIVGLWRQFAQHHGWLLMAAAVAAMVRAARRWREAEGFFLLWFAIGAVGFSLVDWRQTKHLAKLLPPLIVMTGVLWASLAGKAKTVMTVLLAGALLVNVWNTLHLMADFEYIRPVPIW